ncbi:3-dehydroquinate synthase II [Nocardiopsis rhodophaea]|uniref:3-dehydroquinate synthase II n=1 Tax=Nocardiopsis rhodophaea TaxID=280238 RepID=UPI0031DAC2F9
MKLCWIDVRNAGENKVAIIEEAAHQRVDAIVSDDTADLGLLPPTITRVLLLEDGAVPDDVDDCVDVVIGGHCHRPELGRIEQARESLHTGVFVRVSDHASLDDACKAAANEEWTLIHFTDPTKIPLEIVLAAAHNATGNTITAVSNVEEAEIVLGVLEHGSEGVMLAPTRVGETTDLKRACTADTRSLDLDTLTVTGIAHVGLGDRACIDTCTYLRPDEGILVGSHAKGLILGCSETHPLPYMPTRPFRVNAGAIHSYTLSLDGRTNYLSELRSGQKVLAVDHTGRTRPVTIGRVKIESRPLLSIDAESSTGVPINLIVQDDWHVRLLGPQAEVRNVTELRAGDQLLGYLPSEERHVGYPIEEFCIEQ